jgi:hypothetical protein
MRDCVSDTGIHALLRSVLPSSSCFRYRDIGHRPPDAAPARKSGRTTPRTAVLDAAGERRQDFNLYGLAQPLLEIFLVGRASINQYGARLDDPVETRIRPFPARDLEGLGHRLGLDYFLGNACCGPCASPVMKGYGHHCVTLRHALRPFRGG